MKITIAIAMLSIANAAAIQSSLTVNQIQAEEPLANGIAESIDEKIEFPDWFVQFNNYLELENDSDFDLDEYLDQLEDDQATELSMILYIMEGNVDVGNQMTEDAPENFGQEISQEI